MQAEAQTEATERFRKDPAAQAALAATSKLADVASDNFDAVFYPGGHGPLWDLAEDRDSERADRTFVRRRQAGGGGLPRSCRIPPYARTVTACRWCGASR